VVPLARGAVARHLSVVRNAALYAPRFISSCALRQGEPAAMRPRKRAASSAERRNAAKGAERAFHIGRLEPPPAMPDGDAVVFVHGLGGSAEVWKGLFPGFTRPFRLLSLEMPWSGKQGSGWSACSPSQWIHRALREMPTRILMIVAHSFGANAVLEYLDAYGTGRVERLALLSPFYDAQAVGRRVEEDFSLQRFQELITDGFRRASPERRVRAEIHTSMARRIKERVGTEGWAEFVRMFAGTPKLRLEALDLPCLLMAGEEDLATPLVAVAALAAAMPNSTLVGLPRCGHFGMADQPGQVLAALNAFVSSSRGGELWAVR